MDNLTTRQKIQNHIKGRIDELNKADADFCKDRWDITKPQMERTIYREISNQVTFARQELELILNFINIMPNE